MSNAIIALNIVTDHRQKASDDARLQRAKDIIATGHADGQTLWRSTPREYDRLSMNSTVANDHMLHALAQIKRIAAAARVEAELVAGDLLEQERVRNDEIRRQNGLAIKRESAARQARFEALSAVEKRKVRRAATYQRNKIIRRMQETERQQNIDEARRMQEWERRQNTDDS